MRVLVVLERDRRAQVDSIGDLHLITVELFVIAVMVGQLVARLCLLLNEIGVGREGH